MRPIVRHFSFAAWYGVFSLSSPSSLATLTSRNASFLLATVVSNFSPSSHALTVERIIFSGISVGRYITPQQQQWREKRDRVSEEEAGTLLIPSCIGHRHADTPFDSGLPTGSYLACVI